MSDAVHRALQLLDGLRYEIGRYHARQAALRRQAEGKPVLSVEIEARGDFDSERNPHVISRLEWWERALRDALTGRDPLRCVECGMEAAVALCPEHAP